MMSSRCASVIHSLHALWVTLWKIYKMHLFRLKQVGNPQVCLEENTAPRSPVGPLPVWPHYTRSYLFRRTESWVKKQTNKRVNITRF